MRTCEVNEFQTPIEQLELEKYPEEIQTQFWDFMDNVPFIKWLISPNRPRAKDLPRDDQGRIIVDITKPHILEDMDYFRQPAIHFKKTGRYTDLKPNPNPNSQYMKWLKEEIRRCWYGYVRESDGEWVTGNMYFYLNYYRMEITDEVEDKQTGKKKKKGNRRVDFPDTWEGVYWRFHYIEQAQNGGLFNDWEGGESGCEVSSRGKAHPYSQKVYTPTGLKNWGDIQIGDYLYGDDGNITKVIDIPFNQEDDIYKITLKDGRTVMASGQHLWKVLKRHDNGQLKIMSTIDMMKKLYINRTISYRNPTGKEYLYAIPANKGVDWSFKDTKVDPYTFGLLLGDGCFVHDSCNMTQLEEDFSEERNYIPYNITKWNSKFAYHIHIPHWKKILQDYGLYYKRSHEKFIPEEYKFNSRLVRLNILKGLMDTDGFVNSYGVPMICVSSKQLADDIEFIARSLGYNCLRFVKKSGYKDKDGVYKQCLNSYAVKIYTDQCIFNLTRKQKLVSSFTTAYQRSNMDYSTIVDIQFSHREKAKCVTVDNDSHCYLIGDFITTHNSKSHCMAAMIDKYFMLGESEEVRESVKTLVVSASSEFLDADGILNKFNYANEFAIQRSELQFPKRRIKSSMKDMEWKSGYVDLDTKTEKGTLNQVFGVTTGDSSIGKIRGKRMQLIVVEEFGSFPSVLEMYNIMKPSWIEGDIAFGFCYMIGTTGEKESDFAGASEIVYNPKGYRMYALPNNWDLTGLGRRTITFFFPGYINYKGHYNHDGVSDVTASLLKILITRYDVKYNTTDINSITRTIAEIPITPQEALLRVRASMFPVAQLNERVNQLDNDPSAFDDVYVVDLVINKNGEVEYQLTNDEPIRSFPHDANNKQRGALEIFQMPQKDSKGDVIPNRYIAACDPIDQDNSETMSLYSIFVLDLFTDEIVAEYTGRPMFADEGHELLRKLCIFYNCKCCYEQNLKGVYAYFQKMRSLHLLCDTPQYLKDKGYVKPGLYGNTTKGILATAPINNYANQLTRDWLLKPVVMQDKDGNEQMVPQLYKVRNRAFLKECILYTPNINVDRVRAFGLLMLYRQEFIILYEGDFVNHAFRRETSPDYAGNDEFFKKNYTDRFKNKELNTFDIKA